MSTVALDHYKNLYLSNALLEAERKANILSVQLQATYQKLSRAKSSFNEAHKTRENLLKELNSSIQRSHRCSSTDQNEEESSCINDRDDEDVEYDLVIEDEEEDEDGEVEGGEEEWEEVAEAEEVDGDNNPTLSQEEEKYLQYVWKAQEKMENGQINDALRAELKATKVLNRLDNQVDSKIIFSKSENTFQVSAANLLRPRSLLCGQDVTRLLSEAEEIDESEISDPMFALTRFFQRDGPVDLNSLELAAEVATIRRFHLSRPEGIPFEMNEEVLESLQIAMNNRVVKNKEDNAAQLTPPHTDSALIARYNQDAHFNFESSEAIASVDLLQDSLCRCKLRSRPRCQGGGTSMVERKIPFEFPSYGISGFDMDGDILAMCGNRFPLELRIHKNYVGFMKVSCPVKLAELLTATGGHIYCNTTCCLYRGKTSSEWFAKCVADSANGIIWAASSISGTIHGFPQSKVVAVADSDDDEYGYDDDDNEDESSEDVTETKRANKKEGTGGDASFVPKLTFREEEIAAAKQFCNAVFPIAKSDHHIFGSAGTNCLSVWSIDKALRGEESESAAQGIDVHANKKARTISSSSGSSSGTSEERFLQPQTIVVDVSNNFATGDVQWVGGSRVLVAPLRTFDGEDVKSKALRLVDVEAEAVVGLFCGNQSDVSIEKQYCVDTHNLVFSADGIVGLVWDIRTYRPSFTLDTARHGQVLGVPTGCATVAFTFGGNDESIACWDLRMPACQAYAMATGNTVVDSLLWHEPTASLLASTNSNHVITYGKYSPGFMYGETVEDGMVMSIDGPNWWPQKSVYEASYFSEKWHCDCSRSPRILRYAFQNY